MADQKLFITYWFPYQPVIFSNLYFKKSQFHKLLFILDSPKNMNT